MHDPTAALTTFAQASQRLAALCKERRLRATEAMTCNGPPHRPVFKCTMRFSDGSVVVDRGKTKKKARQHVQMRALYELQAAAALAPIPWETIVRSLDLPVLAFPADIPWDWFAGEADVLGVDFEGTPPVVAQVCCRHGVWIDRLDRIVLLLQDPRHLHVVFGAHETHLVARPFDLQAAMAKRFPLPWGCAAWSLADSMNLMSEDLAGERTSYFAKDGSMHRRTDWAAPLSAETIDYAASDAIATRSVACHFFLPDVQPEPPASN